MRKFLTTNLERTAEGGWAWQINLPILTDAIPVLEKNPLHADDRYAGSTRFIAGGKSTYIEASDHELIHRHFPAVDITVLPDVGHNPHMEAREAFVAAVRG
jgi:pimeloyl-ACP methyl ester carboxylesterase